MTALHSKTPLVPMSWGEILDKITILEIKNERIANPAALENVRRELDLLRQIEARAPGEGDLAALKVSLRDVNLALWEIEDEIRVKEAQSDFGPAFVELARSVYKTNDRRAAIKRQINRLLGSKLVEEKSYADYGASGD